MLTKSYTCILDAKRFYIKAKSLLPGLVFIGLTKDGYIVKYAKYW
jgi:hypothetical protein